MLISCGRSQESTFPKQYVDDRENFTQSGIFLNRAWDLTKPPDETDMPFKMPEGQEKDMLSLIEKAILLSKKVDDGYLDYLHPELRIRYRNNLIKGSELYLIGQKEEKSGPTGIGVQKHVTGIELLGEWSDWWTLNGRTIEKRAYPNE